MKGYLFDKKLTNKIKKNYYLTGDLQLKIKMVFIILSKGKIKF